MTSDTSTMESSAMLMSRVPLSWFGRSGALALGAGRLRFTASDGATVFDHPVGELHSIARRAGGVGFDVWHDQTRDRIHPLQRRFTIGEHENSMVSLAVKVATTKWCEFLAPQVAGSPPPGAKVRRPWPMAVHMLVGMAACVGVVAAAVGIPLALT